MAIRIQDGYRDNTNIIHGPDEYSYHANKALRNGRLFIRCFRYGTIKCKGAATVDPYAPGGDFRRSTRHIHPPDRLLYQERRFRRAVLDRCRVGDLSNFIDIYHDERTTLRIPDEAAGAVPFHKLRPAMQNARTQGRPNIPHSLTELANILQNPEHANLTATLDDEENLFAAVVGQTAQRTRAVLFFSRRMLRYMETKVTKIFTDGTFVIPLNLGCVQIWVFTTVRQHHIITLGWVLMQSKLTACYVAVLRALRRLAPNFRPNEVMCDFELAEQNAWAEVYPNAEAHGCYFHFCSATCENAKELGLVPFLRENLHADSIVRSLCALPLLKTEDLDEGFASVVNRAAERELEELAPLFHYFNTTWLTPARKRLLSVYECEDRTNNICESHNRTLRAQVKVAHPNIFQLMSGFVRMEDISHFDIGCFVRGDPISKNRRLSALVNDRRISQLTSDLYEGPMTIEEFLRAASRRIQGVYDEILR